jgi:hypothetical protein
MELANIEYEFWDNTTRNLVNWNTGSKESIISEARDYAEHKDFEKYPTSLYIYINPGTNIEVTQIWSTCQYFIKAVDEAALLHRGVGLTGQSIK